MEPVRRPETARREQPRMLHITLTPTPVALRRVDQRRRSLFVRAIDISSEPHTPTRFAHERGLDEVVRQNASAERLGSRQIRQRAMFDEGLHANNGVVSPIVSFVLLPVIQAREK